MEFSDGRKGDRAAAIDGTQFEYRKLSSNGLWGVWSEAKDDRQGLVDFDRAEWQARKAAEAEARQRELAAAMPAAERDSWYQNYFSGLSLTDSDRAMLQAKGLTDSQIETFGAKSLDFGYVYPIRDVNGLVVGAQIRLTEPGDSGRYRWHGTPGGKHLPDTGELPLAVFPAAIPGDTAALCEGTGAKPYILNQKSGLLTVGAAGGLFPASAETLRATLERSGVKRVRFYPDAGCLVNKGSVMAQYQQLFTLLDAWGYDCEIGYWGHCQDKQQPDIDELGDYSQIRYLSVEQFLQLAAAAREAQRRRDGKISFQYDPAIETERDERDRLRAVDLGPQVSRAEWLAKKAQASGDRYKDETERIQAELNNLRVEPTISATGRYIQPGMLALPERSGIVLINASMGTGKTATAIKGLVNDHRSLYSDAFRMLGVPRNLLGYQSGFELGLPHHKLLKSILNEITLCLESLLKLDPALLPSLPPLIILDEASQTFKQILYGETCKDTQVAILNRLRQIFQWVKQQGGWIVLSEDGLTNCEIDFVQDLSGLEVVESLKFTKELEQTRDYLVFPSPSLTWSEIEGRLFGGENIIACTDSAKWARETERWAINHCGLSPESVKVIDSRSSEEPWVKQFATNPDGFIAQDKPRLLIYTPSVNSGVSIADPGNHFDAMAIHLVHLEAREAKQLPDRLRTDVPRFGYVKERGATTDDQFSSCRPDVLIRDLHRNVEGIKRITRFAEYALEKQPTDRDGNQIDLISTLDQVRNSQHDPTSEYGFWLKHWARYRAREAYSKLSLRDNLMAIWEQQGHKVELLEADAIKPLIEQRKEIREQLDTEQADRFALADASQLSLEDARSILNTLGSTQDDRLKAWKRLTIDKLPGCNLDDSAFVLKSLITDNGRFLKATERLWLAINPDAAKMIDRWAWMGAFTRATAKDEIVWLPRLSVRAGQAKLIHESPLHLFIQGEITQWDNNTAEAISVHEWALLHGRQLKRYMRINVSEDHSPVKTVNKILRHIGLDVIQTGWKGSRKERQRQYAIENLQDADRDAILQALTDRFLSRCEEKQESPPPSVIATRADINPPTSCDHTPVKDESEDLVFIRKMWADAAGNPAMLNEIRQMIPADQLRRAIA